MVSSDQRAVPVRGSCDQPALYLRACDFFQNLSECGVNEIVDATMPVNPYDDDWVSLRWPNGKDDLEIVRASKKKWEGNSN